MLNSRGIVLKTFFTSQYKIILLDMNHGKIAVVPTTEQICNGALVRYILDKRINTYHALNIEQHALPLTLDHTNLFFYHHVLELCYYFIPLDSGPSNLFYVMQELCCLDITSISYRYKIIFLVRLFLVFGIHTEIPDGQWTSLKEVFATGIDSIILETIDLNTIDEMRQWLQGCLVHHPLLKKFKTLQFLNKIEMESL